MPRTWTLIGPDGKPFAPGRERSARIAVRGSTDASIVRLLCAPSRAAAMCAAACSSSTGRMRARPDTGRARSACPRNMRRGKRRRARGGSELQAELPADLRRLLVRLPEDLAELLG